MKIEIEISNQDIEDMLITALEGGSNYWYNLPDVGMAVKYYEHLPRRERPAMSEMVVRSVLEHDAVIPVYDVEDDNVFLGNISKENIARGLQMYASWEHANLTPDMDAGDADVLLQFIVMGEIVFG